VRKIDCEGRNNWGQNNTKFPRKQSVKNVPEFVVTISAIGTLNSGPYLSYQISTNSARVID
jgi:hypothetical protein